MCFPRESGTRVGNRVKTSAREFQCKGRKEKEGTEHSGRREVPSWPGRKRNGVDELISYLGVGVPSQGQHLAILTRLRTICLRLCQSRSRLALPCCVPSRSWKGRQCERQREWNQRTRMSAWVFPLFLFALLLPKVYQKTERKLEIWRRMDGRTGKSLRMRNRNNCN